MGFRVVDQSTFAFETDLPASARNIHPSGVLHAFRSTASDVGRCGREEHTFAWIADSLHVEPVLSLLESEGFDPDRIVFIPYSTKRNWLDRYPHASPALECTADGEVMVYINHRPYPNGLGEIMESQGAEGAAVAVAAIGDGAARRRKRKRRTAQGELTDLERDELHVEMYNYFRWLRARLAERNKKKSPATKSGAEEEDVDVGIRPDATAPEKKRGRTGRPRKSLGARMPGLEDVLKSMEATFDVLPSGEAAESQEEEAEDAKEEPNGASNGTEGPPFLQEALGPALAKLVEARAAAGKGKRARRKPKPKRKAMSYNDFDDMFRRLVKFKDEYGHDKIPWAYEDQKLVLWVNGIRDKRAAYAKRGIESEEPAPGKPVKSARMLTAERIAKFDGIGFTWVAKKPHLSWEDRFRALIEYYGEHGSWPAQSQGELGGFVHRQRKMYAKNDPDFMKTKFPRLDEAGFEWTPNGLTRISWDDGFDMLMEFRRIHGHFNVPRPTPDGEPIDRKSNGYRLYNWVRSLNASYWSYKMGRKSGDLNDGRVMLLIKHGFVFSFGPMTAP